jgi:hypothetical protein
VLCDRRVSLKDVPHPQVSVAPGPDLPLSAGVRLLCVTRDGLGLVTLTEGDEKRVLAGGPDDDGLRSMLNRGLFAGPAPGR